MKSTLMLIGILFLLSACGAQNDNSAETLPREPKLHTDLTIDIDGVERSYHLYDPGTSTVNSVVFLLHGNRGSSNQIIGLDNTVAPFVQWIDIALEENLLLVVPNGAVGPEGNQGWNDCRTDALGNPSTDDVLFINTLIDNINLSYPRSDNRVFVNGISNGGMMSKRLAEEIPERLIGFASIVASEPVNTKCVKSTLPISALVMNGTADPILPYAGGQIVPKRGLLFSTVDAVSNLVNRNQANPIAEEVTFPDIDSSDGSTVTKYIYSNTTNKTKVVHYEVLGGGHTEPSLKKRYAALWKLIVGSQNGDIEMADEVWTFFESLLVQ